MLAAGDGNVGLSASELDIIKANQEGSDFVVIGAMYQKNPLGLTWMTATGIETVQDLVGKRIGGPQGDQVQIDALFKVNGLSARRLRVHPDGLRPAAARRRRDGCDRVVRHEPTPPTQSSRATT